MIGIKRRSTDELLHYFATGELNRVVDLPLKAIPSVTLPRVVNVHGQAYLLQAYSVMRWSWLLWLCYKFANWRAPEEEKVKGRLPFMPPIELTLHFIPRDHVGPQVPELKRLSLAAMAPPGCTLSATFRSLNSLEDHLCEFGDYTSPSTVTREDNSTVMDDFMAQQRAIYQ